MTELDSKNLVKLDPELVPDPLVRGICESLINRSNMGILKFGNTMAENKYFYIIKSDSCH